MEATNLSSQSSYYPSLTSASTLNIASNKDQNTFVPATTELNDVPPTSNVIDETKVSGKRKPSVIWKKENFKKVQRPDGTLDQNRCFCVACNEIVPCENKKNGTSSAWAHAKRCKLNPLYKTLNEDACKNQKTLNRDNISGAVLHHQFNQKRCDEKLVEMIIIDELPFRFVEAGGFRAFVNEIQPRYKIPGRKTIAKLVLEKHETEKVKLKSQLAANSTRVSITTDTWTSIQNINYLVLTAHFMDSDWKLHKRIISFCVITSHKGEDIGRVVESCLRQWDITKVFTITVDNASANNQAVDHMKKRLRSYKTLVFNGEYLHLRCACHILNLIVKDGLKELENGIQAIWNCVKFIRSSPSRLKRFREFAVLEHMRDNANVPLDVATRWNSTYKMLEVALKYEFVFTRMADEDLTFQNYFKEIDRNGNIRVGPPLDEDWRNAEAFVVFLKRFYEATLKLSAWKSVTANLFFVEMIGLQYEIEKRMLTIDPVLQSVASSMKDKFHKYWGPFEIVNKLIFIANVLDPRYKMQYYSKGMLKLGTLEAIVDANTSELKNILVKMYEEYKSTMDGASDLENATRTERNRYTGVDVDGLDEILADCIQERLDEHNESISNEVDQYLADKYVTPYVGFDISGWWKNNASVYPVLSCLAKDIFAVPCSTVASENAFSLGSRIVDPFRSSLTPRTVEALVCCSDWLRADEVNFYKEPTEDELEFYASLEETEQESLTSGVVERTESDVL